MKVDHVDGENKGHVMLFALSTCVWCKKAKRLLNELGVAYDYVNMDLLDEDQKRDATNAHARWNPSCSYPTLVINEAKCIVGFDENAIRKALEK